MRSAAVLALLLCAGQGERLRARRRDPLSFPRSLAEPEDSAPRTAPGLQRESRRKTGLWSPTTPGGNIEPTPTHPCTSPTGALAPRRPRSLGVGHRGLALAPQTLSCLSTLQSVLDLFPHPWSFPPCLGFLPLPASVLTSVPLHGWPCFH